MRTLSSLEYSEARLLLEYIVDQAGDAKVAICVVDATGKLLAAASINGAASHYMTFALAKAITGLHEEDDTAGFRHDQPDHSSWVPKEEGQGWSEGELILAAQLSPGFCGWAGGSVVIDPSEELHICGSIGVSGLMELEDQELADKLPARLVALILTSLSQHSLAVHLRVGGGADSQVSYKVNWFRNRKKLGSTGYGLDYVNPGCPIGRSVPSG